MASKKLYEFNWAWNEGFLVSSAPDVDVEEPGIKMALLASELVDPRGERVMRAIGTCPPRL